MVVTIIHPGLANISRETLTTRLAKMYKVEPEVVSVFGLKTAFGGGRTAGFALIYDSVDALKKFEPKHRLAKKGFAKVTKSARKQRKERKNRAKKVRGKKKADVLGKK